MKVCNKRQKSFGTQTLQAQLNVKYKDYRYRIWLLSCICTSVQFNNTAV